jgi:heme exporter protein B
MRAFLAIVRRDLLVEGRARELIPSMVLLALLLLTVASATGVAAAPAVLWVSVVVAISFGLARSFHHELQDDQLSGLAMAPVDRATIYLGKATANLVIVIAAEAAIVAVFAVLYNVDVGGTLLPLITVMIAGTVGIVAMGTLLGAMIAVTRLRETLVPMLLLPVAVPAVLAAVRATERVLAGRPIAGVQGELQLLAAFALLCIAVPVVVFEYVLEE